MCRKVLFLLFSVCFLSAVAFGETTTWTGTDSNDWSTSTNWDAGEPNSADLGLITLTPSNQPVIFNGTTANVNQLLVGQGDPILTLESGATLNIGIGGISSGYVAGSSWLVINGDVNCTGWFGMADSYWWDGVDPNTYVTGHSDVVLNDTGATLDVPLIQFGKAELEGGNYVNKGGTANFYINAGTVTTEAISIPTAGYGDKLAFDISSASNGTLSVPSSANASWLSENGFLLADTGIGTVEIDTTSVPGRNICTARAYNPATDDRRIYNHVWDNGGSSQSVVDHWNYVSNTLPWPGDVFATTGMAPLGSHPIIDVNAQVAILTVGWGESVNDYVEISEGITIDLIGLSSEGAQGQGKGDFTLGSSGLGGDTFATRGRGTLVMNGGTMYCNHIWNGSGDEGSLIYGQGHIEMDGGLIDCNAIVMSIPDTEFPSEPPFGLGSINLNGGTINITNESALYGMDDSNGIHITGGTLIIEDSNSAIDMNGIITGYIAGSLITTDPGWKIFNDYNETNPGKATVYAVECAAPADLDFNCEINISDLEVLAGRWLDEVTFPGESLFLFNTSVINQGLWSLGLNNDTPGAYLPSSPFDGGYVVFNDTALNPNPNTPLVGDVNGDDVADIVTVGKNGDGNVIFLGRNSANNAGAADLTMSPIGIPGFDQNWSPRWDPNVTHMFLADVDGDGRDDAVTVKPTSWDSGATIFVEASHSDADGLEGNAPVISFAAGILNPHADWTPIMGDFNGDGAVDIAQQRNSDNFVNGMVSTPGTGLNASNPTFWGGIGKEATHLATLVGDINGDGMDDIVQVDERSGAGYLTWVAVLTGVTGDPAGIGIGTGGSSWASPFSPDANSITIVPLLADINDDGKDDLVVYEEYLNAGNVWSRVLAAYTVGTDLFGSTFNEATWFDWVGMTGLAYTDMIPIFGQAHTCDEYLGDVNNDCIVDFIDFAMMAEKWATTGW